MIVRLLTEISRSSTVTSYARGFKPLIPDTALGTTTVAIERDDRVVAAAIESRRWKERADRESIW